MGYSTGCERQPAGADLVLLPVEVQKDLALEQVHGLVDGMGVQRLSLEADPTERAALYLRQGRAIGWITDALAPLADRLPEPAIHRFALAIRATVGIEALSWLTDVGNLDRQEAVDIMSWSAQALLNAALTTGPPADVAQDPGGRANSRRRQGSGAAATADQAE